MAPPKRKILENNEFSASRTRVSGDNITYQFGKAVYPPHGSFGPWWQTAYQLVILLSGSVRVSVDGVLYDLLPGEAILQRPNQEEIYRFSATTESIHTWCWIPAKHVSVSDKTLFVRARGVHKAPSSVNVLIEEGLAVDISHESPDLHTAMLTLARACLLRFAAHAALQESKHTAMPAHPALERALEIASKQFTELHSAEDLAHRVGISSTHLRTLFRRYHKESPATMIWRLKVEHAIQIIRSTGLTLGEIAEQCGYSDPFHLSRSVKQATGLSPRTLRQREWSK